MDQTVVGTSVPRQDLPDKLTGRAKFTSDIKLPGMLSGKILRSPYPHARILSIDSSRAEAMPGVHGVVTPFDVPEGRLAPDLAVLDTTVRFVGDEVAAVAADDEDTAFEALGALEVRYETLSFVTDPEEALKPSATPIHGEGNLIGGKPLSLTRGDVEEGFRQADRIFEETYTTPAHSGAALEPRAAIAMWEGSKLTVWKSSRGVHADRISISSALDIPRDDVRVIGPAMGAGYGNKDETRLAALTALLAQRAGRPVKIELTREEEFVAGRKRHATKTTVKVGVKNDGTVTAVHATTIMDTGAYLSSGPGVVRRAGQGALYLYRCANVRYDGYLTYTNLPSGGSYRALGAPQGHFALETTMTKIAMALGMDPLDFRLKNHVGPEGQPGERITPADEIIDTQPVEGGIPFSSNGLRQCLENGAQSFGWSDDAPRPTPASEAKKIGRGMCMFIYRGGPGSRSQARVRLNRDGTIQLIAGLMDVGEGNMTAISQIVAQEMGVRYEQVSATFGDSSLTPEAPITAGSTATFSTGLAAKQAAGELKKSIIHLASDHLAAAQETLSIAGGDIIDIGSSRRLLGLSDVARLQGESELSAEASLMPGSKEFIVNSFGAHFAEVEVDTDTGNVRVLRYVAAHDSGRILNPNLARNQVEGGVSQMLGFALTEQMITDGRSGATVNASFLEHKGPTIQEYPDIEVLFADIEDPVGPFGAKGLGEPPSIGVAPAVVHAIYDALGVWIHDLPATPDKILNALSLMEGEL